MMERPPVINIDVPKQPRPIINIDVPRSMPPIVNVPAQEAPVVNVEVCRPCEWVFKVEQRDKQGRIEIVTATPKM